MQSTNAFSVRKNKRNGLLQIFRGTQHVAWLNTGGSVGPWHGIHPDWQVMIHELCLKPGDRPHYIFFQAIPGVMEVKGAVHTVDVRVIDDAVHIAAKSSEPTGRLRSDSLMAIEPDPDRPGQLRLRYSIEIELLKDLDARAMLAGKEPMGRIFIRDTPESGPCWLFEMCDPWLDSLRGPATRISKDYPYRVPTASIDCFTRRWKKRYVVYAFEAPDGTVKTLPLAYDKLERIPERFFQFLKDGGHGGFFLNRDGNPVIKCQSSDHVGTGLCQWIYDQHIFVAIPLNAPKELWGMANRFNLFNILPQQAKGSHAVLKAGRKIGFQATATALSASEGQKFIEHATPIELPEHEMKFHQGLPAFVTGRNDFTAPLSQCPDANPWLPVVETIWDRNIGFQKPGSLRIQNDSGMIADGAWMVTGGRSFFCEPIRPGVKYRLSGRIKTLLARGEGAWLEAVVKEYKHLGDGVRGERLGKIFRAETAKISGDRHWMPVAAEIGPFPENCSIVQLIARFRGTGTAWFDEIAFEPVKGKKTSGQ